MQQAHEVQVGDTLYTITTFPSFKGLGYLQKILAVVGPSLAQAFAAGAAGDNADDLVVEEDTLSQALALLLQNMDKVNVAKLLSDMVKDSVTINGQKPAFDQEFSANYGALMKVVTAIIKENYSSFFGESGFGELLGLLPQPLLKPESQKNQK